MDSMDALIKYAMVGWIVLDSDITFEELRSMPADKQDEYIDKFWNAIGAIDADSEMHSEVTESNSPTAKISDIWGN